MFIKYKVNPRCGTHRWWKGKQRERRQTVFFTPSDPWRDETEEENRWWLIKAEKNSPPEQVEILSGRRLLDPLSQGTRKGTDILADKGLAPLFFTIQCRRGIRQWRENFVSKTLHASACTENNSQKCLELTATAAAARHHGEHRDTCSGAKPWQPQQIQQREYRDLLRKREIHSKLISEFKEFHKMQYLKIKKDCPKFKKWLTSCELETKPNRSLEIWEERKIQHVRRSVKTCN